MTTGNDWTRRLATTAATTCAALCVFATPALAEYQTWVSGVGDDANPCTRTAPCKTFAGAVSKTETGGEINPLDPGDFGIITIPKALTISATGVSASVLAPSSNGVTINAKGAPVTIDGLDINGLGSGGVGVKVIDASSVEIQSSSIHGFKVGVLVEPTEANTSVIVQGSDIYSNSVDGVLLAPGPRYSAKVQLIDDVVSGNGCGVVATSYGMTASTPAELSTACATNSTRAELGIAEIGAVSTSLLDNSAAALLLSGASAKATVAGDEISGSELGLSALSEGSIASLGGNLLFSNAANGEPTSISDVYVGPAGPAGPIGPSGAAGQQGVQGAMGQAGAAGATGATGPAGTTGAEGPRGVRGPRGEAGKIELVSCRPVNAKRGKAGRNAAHKGNAKRQRCIGKLVSGGVRFEAVGKVHFTASAKARVKATLLRAGKVYAKGEARLRAGDRRLSLHRLRPLQRGSYTLRLSAGGRTLSKLRVKVG